jgi:hypothetical protein
MIGVGRYARTLEGIVYIFGYEDNRYQTVRTDRDEERSVSASELTLWKPRNGERVKELGNDDGVTGTILEPGEEISLVKWDCLLRQVSWVNSCLEPAWD